MPSSKERRRVAAHRHRVHRPHPQALVLRVVRLQVPRRPVRAAPAPPVCPRRVVRVLRHPAARPQAVVLRLRPAVVPVAHLMEVAVAHPACCT